MFDDPKKELQRLQEQLLQDEEWFEKELESAKAMIGEGPGKSQAISKQKPRKDAELRRSDPMIRNYANGYGQKRPPVRNTEVRKPRKGIGGLVVLATLETMGIVGIVAYWMLVLLK